MVRGRRLRLAPALDGQQRQQPPPRRRLRHPGLRSADLGIRSRYYPREGAQSLQQFAWPEALQSFILALQ